MKLIDQYPLYELGAAFQNLKDLSSGEKNDPVDLVLALMTANSQLKRLMDGNPVEISFCRDSAETLRGHINNAIDNFRDKDGRSFRTDVEVPSWLLSRIRSSMEMFEHQFSAELKKTAIYAVPRRGIFDTERLVANADGHLPESTRETLPKFVLSEFRAAGRCLAFGLFSAAGFHALRAAECALKQYYAAFLGDPKKEEMTMGLMASHLKDRVDSMDRSLPKPNAATLRIIADITAFDRNPLTHKELDLSEDDAAILFNRAQGMIALIARELLDRSEELQPALPLIEPPSMNVRATAKAASKRKASATEAS